MYLQTYNDHAAYARRLADILIAWLDFNVSREAARQWCSPTFYDMLDTVTFEEDDDGGFNGEWITAADQEMQLLADEDMGIELNFEGLELLQDSSDSKVLMRAEDSSMASFKTALGTKAINTQQSGEASPAGVAAAVESVGGGAD